MCFQGLCTPFFTKQVEAKGLASLGEYASRDATRGWRVRGNNMKQKCEVTAEYTGYTTRPELKLSGVSQHPRHYDALNALWGMKCNAHAAGGRIPTSKQVKEGLWIDLSQNLDRAASGNKSALCTSSAWYSYQHDFVLDGNDALSIQGHPEVLVQDPLLTSSQKKTLAGESFHLACFGVLMFATYLNPWAEWWKQDKCASASSGKK